MPTLALWRHSEQDWHLEDVSRSTWVAWADNYQYLLNYAKREFPQHIVLTRHVLRPDEELTS